MTASAASPDRDRRLALLTSIALLFVLAAPWYRTTVIVTGVAGHRHGIEQTWSGWQALSAASVVCAAVALATIALMLIRARISPEVLGAAGREAARSRIDGALVGGGGVVALLCLLLDLHSRPGPKVDAVHVTSAVGPLWGLMLAAVLCLALVAAGVQIARVRVAAQPIPTRGSARREPRPNSARARP